jgi:hypothetical protein
MEDDFQNPAEEYEAVAELERIFLERVQDDEIRDAYVAWRKRDKDGFRTLFDIAKAGWESGAPDRPRLDSSSEVRAGKADKAIEIFFLLQHATQ